MSESFVDLSYRGLALGKRIKLTQVRPTSGYLEIPAPMPVGTPIGIATDDGVLMEALVTEVHEQVGGSDRVPGMVVKPKLDADAAQKWWTSHVELPQEKVEKAPPPPDAGGKVTVMSPRMSGQVAIPEVIDDGRNTAVMDAIDDAVVAEVPVGPEPDVRVSAQMAAVAAIPIQDDGKRTMMMDAVDLAALGLDASSSGSMPAMKAADDDDSGGDKPEGKGKKKKKKR